ncbi:MAG: tyrosine-type recombinase/integrase [Actinomycetota bacterium]|nr:tyrosine-type recombinase/integrase [Actinomycetota bacterium]
MAYAQRRVTSSGAVRWYATYFTPDGRQMVGGGYPTKRDAERAADRLEKEAEGGVVADRSRRKITFASYVQRFYWPAAQHLEPTTLAAYQSNLDRHFIPRFGRMRMANIAASEVQAWVNGAGAAGLSARSVVKYHTFLHAIFERAVIDQVIPVNPCRHTVLPKLVKKPKTAITPEQFEALLAEIPDAFRLMVLVAIETGVRWGELAALRPADVDFGSRVITVRGVVLEVARKVTGSESSFVFRDYPKDNEQREVMIGAELCRAIREHMLAHGKRDDDLLFSTSVGTPISRNTFRTRVWRPAVERSGIRSGVRFHDLRGAHASWLLAGGADLKVVMDRLGHRQITTTQQYLGSLPDAGDRALKAFEAVRNQPS